MATRRDSSPLVSCVMPTYNRRRFIPQALRCFANRTYRNAELIVVDDSRRSVRSLCEGVDGVRYLRTEILSLGAKLNLGIEAARGDIIQRIDDDDFYAPGFLAASVAHLLNRDPARTLVTRCCFLTLVGSDGVLRHGNHGWTPGGGFCFHRELWRRIPFRDLDVSEDSFFLRDHQPEVVRICDPAQYIVVRHGANHWTRVRNRKTSRRAVDVNAYFRSLPAFPQSASHCLDAESLAFYHRLLRWRWPR